MLNPQSFAQTVPALRSLAIPIVDLAFRAIHLRWFPNPSMSNPLFGVLKASRYVPDQGAFLSLYFALDAETAYREGNQEFYRLIGSPAGEQLAKAGALRPEPLWSVGTHIQMARMLDLRLGFVRTALGIVSDADIQMPWNAVSAATPTQVLGKAVHADGFFEGIVFPSLQNSGGVCVVAFPDRLLPTSHIDYRGFVGPSGVMPDRRLP